MSDRVGLVDLTAPLPHVQFVDLGLGGGDRRGGGGSGSVAGQAAGGGSWSEPAVSCALGRGASVCSFCCLVSATSGEHGIFKGLLCLLLWHARFLLLLRAGLRVVGWPGSRFCFGCVVCFVVIISLQNTVRAEQYKASNLVVDSDTAVIDAAPSGVPSVGLALNSPPVCAGLSSVQLSAHYPTGKPAFAREDGGAVSLPPPPPSSAPSPHSPILRSMCRRTYLSSQPVCFVRLRVPWPCRR